jgi:hypothetical protein
MAANTECSRCDCIVKPYPQSVELLWGMHDITENSPLRVAEAQPSRPLQNLACVLEPGDDPDTSYVLGEVLHKVLYCSASK